MPRPRNVLLRRYLRKAEALQPGQLVVLILLGLPLVFLVALHLRDLAERAGEGPAPGPGSPEWVRPGLDFYEAERRAAEQRSPDAAAAE